ncbi:MAG: YbhB/YbcL family Raf kinase inhibitor-like protein [Actinomycetota bacterium]
MPSWNIAAYGSRIIEKAYRTMHKLKIFFTGGSIISVLLLLLAACDIEANKEIERKDREGPAMEIISTAFSHNENIPARYTCDGQDINPPLEFSNIPEGTRSLALIADDPDAPAKTWVHWVVWNISPDATGIPEDSKPGEAVEGITDFKKPGYGGPCPPSGTHRYFFKLFALDTELDLDPSGGAGDLAKAMEGHIIESAELIGLYSR